MEEIFSPSSARSIQLQKEVDENVWSADFSHTEFSIGDLLCHPDQIVISFFGFAFLRIIFCFFAITLLADASKTSPSDPCPTYRCF
jgi:hypothetical protein